jgi:hypothetical protein
MTIGGMNYKAMQQRRRDNLAAVVRPEIRGNIVRFAQDHDLDASLISQLLNGHRAFTEPQARELEAKANLRIGSLDADAGAMPGSVEEIEQVFKRSSVLDQEEKDYLLGLIKVIVKKKAPHSTEEGS